MSPRLWLALGAASLLQLHASEVIAQALEEVVVTAQKREQSLQDVAISVAVISGAELEALNKTQISDLPRLVPGFTFASGTSDAGRSIIIRGIGTQSFSRTVDQSVGTVVDGVASGSVSGSILDFSDVERIEVLRGPQGLLFGKNASAGLLSITTRGPTETFTGGFGAAYGSVNLLNLNGYVSGPLVSDKLLGRLAVYRNTMDGMIENKYPGGVDFNDRDEWGARAKLKWLVTDNLDLQLTYNRVERDHICCIGPLEVVTPGSVVDREGGERGEQSDTLLDNDSSDGTTRLDLYALDINYALGDYLLTSITAYIEEDIFGSARGDLYTRTALPRNDSFENYKQFTQELRLTSPGDRKVNYVAGLYFFDKKIDRFFERIIDTYGIDLGPPGFPNVSVLNDADSTSRSYAAFGQMTWNVTTRARLLLGARYNYDTISLDQTVSSLPNTIPEADPGSIQAETDDRAWSWRITGEYDVTPAAMVYATVARGYKGPGANSLPSGPTSGDVFVDPEIPTSYELGIKSLWLDNRLRFNSAIYYTRFKDFQASAQVPNSFPPQFFLTNAGELLTRGVEVEINAQATRQLGLQAAIAYTNAEFSDWQNAPCYAAQTEEEGCVDGEQDLSGATMPDSPRWSFNVGANYFMPIASAPFDGFVRANYFWRDEVQFDTTQNPLHTGDAYGSFDLFLGITGKSGHYTAQFYVQNLFDEFHVISKEGQIVVGVESAHGLPYDYTRRFGVSLRMDF